MNKKIIYLIGFLAVFLFSFNYTNSKAYDKSNIVVLNSGNFNKGISQGYVLVDFWAVWCRPCHIQKPILEEIAIELKGKLTIASLDIDRNKSITQAYNIRSIPCMILFKDGKEVKRLIGLHQKNKLLEELAVFIN